MKGESEAIWLEKWCPQHAVNGAVIKLSEALVAGGINELGLKQDRCEGHMGEILKGGICMLADGLLQVT